MADVMMSDAAPSAASSDAAAQLTLTLSPTLSLDALLSLLPPTDTSGAPIDAARLTTPNAALVLSVYAALSEASAQLTSERTLRQREQVEAEGALHTLQSELSTTSTQTSQAEAKAAAAEAQLDALKTRVETLQRETEAAKKQAQETQSRELNAEEAKRVKDVEMEKRELLTLLDREKTENARVTQEMDALTTRAREARDEASKVSADLVNTRAAEDSAKFKIHSLEQQLSLSKSSSDWANAELQRTTEALTAQRTASHAEQLQLNAALEASNSSLSAAKSKATSLQAAYDGTLLRLNEANVKLADATQRLATQEEAFRTESQTQTRLVALLERRAGDADARARALEEQWEAVLARARQREEAAMLETQNEAEARAAVESECAELKEALDRLAQSCGLQIDANGRVREGSAAFSEASGGIAALSQTAAMAAKVQRSGMSFSQVYADLARCQEELRRERAENHRLGGVLEEVMQQLAEHAPTLQAQREHVETLSKDLEEVAGAMAQACEERDRAEREAVQRKAEVEASRREANLTAQHVADLGSQVRHLARELVIHTEPDAAALLEENEEEAAIAARAAEAASTGDVQAIISANLVTFTSLGALQTQNQNLLTALRQLAARTEAAELEARQLAQAEESEAVAEAKAMLGRLQEELRAERTRAESARRERDMFRDLSTRGGGASAGASEAHNLGAASNGANNGSATANAALANQYATLQSEFDAFKSETRVDTERLKEDVRSARDEVARASVAAARERAQKEASEERYRTLQQTYDLARSELAELSKRTAALQENLARRDLAAHHVETQLIEARSTVERTRNEVANLRAEKELYAASQERVLEDNKALVAEKASLSELLRNVQSMANELDRAGSEARRRLEANVERLEETTKEQREKLARTEESLAQLTLRREGETRELNVRLEKATADAAGAREQLAVAKTTVEHLTTRAEDLSKQLDAKEEKLAVFERRSGGAAGGAQDNSSLTREQQLEMELAEVKGDLRAAQIEVEQARVHVAQFKAIAESNEEALGGLQASYDEYKSKTDALIAEKETEIASRRERLERLVADHRTAQEEASAARQALDAARAEYAADKRALEDALTSMNGLEERARVEQEDVRGEVRKQAQLAREAHAKYEAELVAHADDVRTLTVVKEQLEQARLEAREALTARETAEVNLANSQTSWTAQKASIEKEKEELGKSTADLKSQNAILHKRLEEIGAQAAQIRQAAAEGSAAEAAQGDVSLSETSAADLQDVVKFVRREKEIVDLQLELQKQEAARLRQNLAHAHVSLDEVRLQLSEERERNAGASTSEAQHKELLEKVTQLSILRESNATLRDEAERATRKAAQLEKQLGAKTAELEPLREQLRTAEIELEACRNQMRVLQEDNKRWQARSEQILQQYDRIDPDDVARLEKRAAEAEAQLAEVQERHRAASEAIEAERAEHVQALADKDARFERLRLQTVGKLKENSANVKVLEAELTQLRAEVASLRSANAAAKTSDADKAALAELRAEKTRLEAEVDAAQQALSAREEEVKLLKDQLSAAPAATGASEEDAAEAVKKVEAEKAELQAQYEKLSTREQSHLANAKRFNTDMKKAQNELAEFKSKFEADNADAIEAAVKELAASRTTGEATGEVDGEALVMQKRRITELEEQLHALEARNVELQAALEASLASGAGAGEEGASTPDIEALKQAHAAELQNQHTKLSQQYSEAQRRAVEIAVSKFKGAPSSAEAVEQAVQTRLKALEDEREAAVQRAIAEAVETKEEEMQEAQKVALQERYEAGKNEAKLRTQLLQGKNEKLAAELASLKAAAAATPSAPTPAAASAPAAAATSTAASPTAPAVTAFPVAATTTATPARGGAPARGTSVRGAGSRGGRGRGGAHAALAAAADSTSTGGAMKRKASVADASATAGSASEAGQAAKKARPAGGAIAIRGARGGRGGAPGTSGGTAP